MIWDTLSIRDILSNILWVTENNDVTNEPIPAQLVACWNELAKMARNEPHLVELAAEQMDGDAHMGGTTESLSTFIDNVTVRMKAALSCNCARACTKNICHCFSNQASNRRCNAWCHPNVKNYLPRPCMI